MSNTYFEVPNPPESFTLDELCEMAPAHLERILLEHRMKMSGQPLNTDDKLSHDPTKAHDPVKPPANPDAAEAKRQMGENEIKAAKANKADDKAKGKSKGKGNEVSADDAPDAKPDPHTIVNNEAEPQRNPDRDEDFSKPQVIHESPADRLGEQKGKK